MAGPSTLMLDIFSVFMCKDCKTILAEACDASECNDALDVIACIRATQEVEIKEGEMFDLRPDRPDLLGCVYNNLKCRGCTANVGIMLYCAVAEVAHLRGLFCFLKNSILCYSTKTKQLLEGNRFSINVAHCLTQLQELEKEIVETAQRVDQMTELVKRKVPSPLSENK